LDAQGSTADAGILRDTLSGTLAAWRLTEHLSGEAPSWDTVASSEACYGLLAAWHSQNQQTERAKVAVAPGYALGERAVWTYPESAAQSCIVPLYGDFLRWFQEETQ